MALVLKTLTDNLLEISNNPPLNLEDYALRASNAFHEYAKNVIPVSTTSEKAKEQLYNAFSGKQTLLPISRYEDCYYLYTFILAQGMVGFTSIPPQQTLLDLTPAISFISSGKKETTYQTSLLIHNWMLSATATNIGTNVTTPWS